MQQNDIFPFLLLIGAVVAVFMGVALIDDNQDQDSIDRPVMETFNSSEEFSEFVQYEGGRLGVRLTPFTVQPEFGTMDTSSAGVSLKQTNVQVQGIDEPDNVKLADGVAYYSPERYSGTFPVIRSDIYRQPVNRTTKVIDTTESEDPKVVNKIQHSGKLLRDGNRLIIYNESDVIGYDISEPKNPEQVWTKNLSNNTTIDTARINDGKFVMVLDTRTSGCPLEPVEGSTVECTDIQYPSSLSYGQGVYSAMMVDSTNGDIDSSTTFVGGSGRSTVYMNSENLYVSYTNTNLLLEEFFENGLESVEVDDELKDRVRDINTTEIRTRIELASAVQNSIENTTENRQDLDVIMKAYREFTSESQREVDETVIVRTSLDSNTLSPSAVGSVPGFTLNQYSFDEHNGNLRVATTVSGAGSADSANDLYVLDNSLDIQGSVKNMAEGQSIFAVRFIGDRGYVITFEQIDPLHVIDLSDPTSPNETGILEISGFSDYLHEVNDDEILGVGESQDRRGKIALFNVSNDSNPTLSDSIVLENESRTEISQDYRAFLEDPQTGAYYLPANQGLHVVERSDQGLEYIGFASTPSSAERVRIVGENVYIFHSDGVVSIDRQTYDQNSKIKFED